MVILGVDPSLKATGYGVIRVGSKRNIVLLETGSIDPKQKDLIQNRLHRVYSNLGDIVREFKPDVLVLEKAYTHHQYKTTGIILGHVRGVICLLAAQHQIDLIELSVKRVRKAVVGNGNASKSRTRATIASILNINENQLTLDASDALAMALGYFHLMPGEVK